MSHKTASNIYNIKLLLYPILQDNSEDSSMRVEQKKRDSSMRNQKQFRLSSKNLQQRVNKH